MNYSLQSITPDASKLSRQLNRLQDVGDMAKAKFYMPPVCFIVARSINGNVIGCEGQLPWKLKTDLARFRSLTSHHAIIMGRKTFESIGKPLPNRLNIVVSRSHAHAEGEIDLHGTETKLMHSRSAEDALFCSDLFAILNDSKRIFVIGGAEIYKRFSDRFDRIYLTEVHTNVPGDAYFNYEFASEDWMISRREHFRKSTFDEFDYDFSIIDRRISAGRIRTFSEIAEKKSKDHLCMRGIDNRDAKIIEHYAREHFQYHPREQVNFNFHATNI